MDGPLRVSQLRFPDKYGENDFVASTRRFVNTASAKQIVVVTISIVKATI